MPPWHPLPDEVYSLVERAPGTVLLHSSRSRNSAVSRLFTAPREIMLVRDLAELPALFSKIEKSTEIGHFVAGYFAYECLQYFEPTVALKERPSGPLAWFGIYDRCYRFDHAFGSFDTDPIDSSSKSVREIFRRSDNPDSDPIDYALDLQQFTERIARIQDWIRAGDVYQLNFTFPVHAQFEENPASLYARLSAAQPVDYGAFLNTQSNDYILCFSPELFFRIDARRHITTQPMKGTAPRGRTNSEDHELTAWLASDPKNRAENVMIVDLLRNDLGRLCSFGSVKVEELFEVDRYPSLLQMSSRISGDLLPDAGFEAIFRALFPCGSITGAPKVRAMQLLTQIEERPRDVYTGAIGFFSKEQTIFNVAIRTLEHESGSATMGIGSGIVIDSDPITEYQECRLKAEFLTRSSERFSLIETMLWCGTFPLLEMHLDRLTDSALYFDFRCDRNAIRAQLLAEASRFTSDHPRRVRLLLDPRGEIHVESAILPDSADSPRSLRVCIATRPTNSRDRFLFHKTTKRDLYNRA